ncbi:MAG: prepilin peptidase [Halobacteriaceae archaeon]
MYVASVPDLLRLVVVPVLGWAAWRDLRTRRVPNEVWYPLAVLGVALFGWEVLAAESGSGRVVYAMALSVGIVVPLAYLFWRIGGFGGADAKAFMVLAVVFPTYPTYYLPSVALPLVRATVGVFSLTVLTNAVLMGVVYPVGLAVLNVARGHHSRWMFVGRPLDWSAVPTAHGRLLSSPPDGTGGLDLDALRMYLRWRQTTLAALRADPDRRDPATIPEERGDPTDGAVRPDGGDLEDPWGAEAFLAEAGPAYGTTADELRDGLAVLTERDTVWISPGIPFVVPLLAGLVVALTYGDVLVALLTLVGVQ